MSLREQGRVADACMLAEQRADLAARVLAKIEGVAQSDGVDVKKVVLHMNANANDTGANDFVRGHVTIFGERTPLTEAVLHANLFAQVMMFPVRKIDEATGAEVPIGDLLVSSPLLGDSLRSTTAATAAAAAAAGAAAPAVSLLDALNAGVPQSATSARAGEPSLHCMANDEELADDAEWQSVLGDGGRVGLYRVEHDTDEYTYMLLVHVDKTRASQQLYEWVCAQERRSMTLAEFVASKRYRYVHSLNARNARRLGAKAATALGLHVDTVCDTLAYVPPNSHKVRPRLAVPSVHNEYNVVYPGRHDGQPACILFDDVVCTRHALGAVLLLGDAAGPVYAFPPTAHAMQHGAGVAKTEAVGAPAGSVRPETKGVTNVQHTCFSFPYTLGMHDDDDTEAFLVRAAAAGEHPYERLSEHERAKIDRRVTWEHKVLLAGADVAARVRGARGTAFNHTVLRSMHRVHSANADGAQTAVLRSMYSTADGDHVRVATYKPVAVKVSARTYEGHDV